MVALSKLAKDTRKWLALSRPQMVNAIIYTEKVLEATEEIPGRERAFFIFEWNTLKIFLIQPFFKRGGGVKLFWPPGRMFLPNPHLKKNQLFNKDDIIHNETGWKFSKNIWKTLNWKKGKRNQMQMLIEKS